MKGAIRRLLKGVVPMIALRTLLVQIPPRTIPWDFVDLIETDPARRVKLKISHERLAKLHPADIADIIEELTPDERDAVFQTLEGDVAAGALEEVAPKVQKAIVEALDSERAAEIVEEMNPDAAADLLADLPEERTSQILQEMEPQEREEMVELLEFRENTAAGRMNTEYLAQNVNATVKDAIEALRKFEGGVETVSTIYLSRFTRDFGWRGPIVEASAGRGRRCFTYSDSRTVDFLRGRRRGTGSCGAIRQIQPGDACRSSINTRN